MWIIAHRGNSKHHPENTLAAIESALFHTNADGIEIDLYCSKDKQLIVIHDESLERTTSGQGYVHEQTYQQISRLDAGSGEKVPLLSEILRLVPDNKWLNLELKGHDTADALIELFNTKEFSHWQNASNLLISSFNHHLLVKIKQHLPKLKLGALTASLPLHFGKFAEELGAWSIHCDKQFLTPEFVLDAKQRNLKVFTYTVDLERDIHRMLALGVDAIFSNDPQHSKTIVFESNKTSK